MPFYAAQTFNNSPDERTIIIGWLRTSDNNVYVDNKMPFNQHMSFPTIMKLKTTADGIKLFRWPIEEVKSLYEKSLTFEKIKSVELNEELKSEKFKGIDLYAKFDQTQTSSFQINILRQVLTFEKVKFYFNELALPTLNKNEVNFRVLLDRTSIEVFTDDGFSVFSTYTVLSHNEKSIYITSDKVFLFDEFEIHKLGSIWP